VSALATTIRAVHKVNHAVAGKSGIVDRWLSRGRRRLIATAVVIVLLLVTIFAGTILVLAARKHAEAETARTEGLHAAIEDTTKLLSYDYRTLDANLSAADAITTGEFADQYRGLATQLIKPNAMEQQIVTTAQVVGSSVVTATPGGLVALLYLNQTTTGREQPTPRIDRSRARVTLILDNGSWRISEIAPV
jgi:Mce-associated membrane protein